MQPNLRYNTNNSIVNINVAKNRTNTILLEDTIKETLNEYFRNLGGMTPAQNLHEKILAQVEKPLIENVLKYVKGNQLRAASILGINRNTLRKKIQTLGIDVNEATARKL